MSDFSEHMHPVAARGLMANAERAAEFKRNARDWPSRDCPPALVNELELLLIGAVDCESAYTITMPAVEKDTFEFLAMRDPEGVLFAVLAAEFLSVKNSEIEITGTLTGIELPTRYDFKHLRLTPAEVWAQVGQREWRKTFAVLTAAPLSEKQLSRINDWLLEADAGLILLICSAPETADDSRHFSRVRAIANQLAAFPAERVLPCLIPLKWSENEEHLKQVGRNFGASDVRILQPEGETATIAGQGFTVFFTGFSGSGKSTVANILLTRLLEGDDRAVTLLDGDLVRKNLSSELGFSREHRNLNIRRIGFVASLITKSGGIAVCAPIAPYDEIRKEVRTMVEPYGPFVLVHISTPIEECERRDRKGLYAKARAGIIKEFTGISDPYEVPEDAGLVIDTTDISPEDAADQVMQHLAERGLVAEVLEK